MSILVEKKDFELLEGKKDIPGFWDLRIVGFGCYVK